jgi:GAF domain-containing protein
MAEEIFTIHGPKQEQYKNLLQQLAALVQGEDDLIANMANICGALKEQFNWLWIGFYRVIGNELVLGPFQGPIACTRIQYGKGVCGQSWMQAKTLVVADVEKFPGHIACSSLSRSEIVVPIFKNGDVVAVLDVDSEQVADFDDTDRLYLEQVVSLLKH